MSATLAILTYALTLFVVSLCAAQIMRRSFVPQPNMLQKDGTYDYLPSHTHIVFVLVTADVIWLSTYNPAPPYADLVAAAISNTGWLMFGLLLLIRKESFRVVGFEGRRQILIGAFSFLMTGTLLANRTVLMSLWRAALS